MLKKIFYIFILLVSDNLFAGMRIHKYMMSQFKSYRYDTDYMAFKILEKNPLPYDVNYLVIPWTKLIGNSTLKSVPKIHLNGGFTICQDLRYERIIPILKRIGINVLFTPSARRRKSYNGITVLPIPFNPINSVGPKKKKDILYSFIGANPQVPIRKAIFSIKHPSCAVVKKRTHWQFFLSPREQKKNAAEYKDVLSRSRYSLCPRGVGPASIRFWESLRAGAIPVLFDNGMWLPDQFDWSCCTIRLTPHDVPYLEKILKQIPHKQEALLRKNCFKAYKCFSGKNLVSVVFDYYNKKFAAK